MDEPTVDKVQIMTETTMTWREWINQYDPVEIVIEFSGYNPLSIQSVVLQWKTPVANMTGMASGNEWRSKDGRWYMRGRPHSIRNLPY